MGGMPDRPAPHARRWRAPGRAPEPGVETSPLGIRRLQTRPLPLAASPPPRDETPTVARAEPSAPGLRAPGQDAPGQDAPGQAAPGQDATADATPTAAG